MKGEVQIKDLILGAELTAIKDRDEYLKKQAEAQFAVPEDKLGRGRASGADTSRHRLDLITGYGFSIRPLGRTYFRFFRSLDWSTQPGWNNFVRQEFSCTVLK